MTQMLGVVTCMRPTRAVHLSATQRQNSTLLNGTHTAREDQIQDQRPTNASSLGTVTTPTGYTDHPVPAVEPLPTGCPVVPRCQASSAASAETLLSNTVVPPVGRQGLAFYNCSLGVVLLTWLVVVLFSVSKPISRIVTAPVQD